MVKESQGLSWVHWFCRDTMLQALRFVIQGAGAKVDVAIRKNIVSLLLSMLGHDEVRLLVGGGAGGLSWFPFSWLWLVSLVCVRRIRYSCQLLSGNNHSQRAHHSVWFPKYSVVKEMGRVVSALIHR